MATVIFKMAAKDCAAKYPPKPTMELKRRAVQYYNDNNVPRCLEELLNSMFLDDPEDIFGYMAEYFSTKSKVPTVKKIEFMDTISSRGHNSFISSIFCQINGIEKPICTISSLFDDGPKVETQRAKSKPATGSKSKTDKKISANASVTINNHEGCSPKPKSFDYELIKDDIIAVSERITGHVMMKQKDMDEMIRSSLKQIKDERTKVDVPSEDDETADVPTTETNNPEKLCDDCLRKTKVNYSELYLSLMTAKLSSHLKKNELFESLCDEFKCQEDYRATLPSPMVLMMKCGTESLGKLNLFRGVYIVPKLETSLLEGFQQIASVYRELGNVLNQKLGVNGRLVSDDGCYSPSLERPEQVFDYLQNAFAAVNMDMESHFDIILDIGATYFYEEEKKKYEISTGNFRTSEDLLQMYSDFVERYHVIGIIDGMSHKDPEGYSSLTKQLGGKCFCFGDSLFMENVDFIEDFIENQTCNGAVLRLGNYFNNLTELNEIATHIRDSGCGLIMPTTTAQHCSSQLVADLATAFGATFIAIGAPTHIENTDICNRLLQIEHALQVKNKLKPRNSYYFPEYKEETEQIEENGENELNSEEKQ